MKRTVAAGLIASAFGLMASLACADPQASATTALNFTFTFKDAAGAVLDMGSLHTDWGFDISYNKSVFSGSPVSLALVYEQGHGIAINDLNESRNASQGTALGQTTLTGAYGTTGIPAIGASAHAEVGGGLLNAQSESIVAGSSVYNLTFSAATSPIYLYIDYDYSITFQTTVLDPSRWWEWSAGGKVTMGLSGGGMKAGVWEYVYPYDPPSTTPDFSKFELFSISRYSDWSNGTPSGVLSGNGSLAPILLTREGFESGIGWNLEGDVTAAAYAPGVEILIPEPETYAMLLAGLGVIGLMARRRIGNAT